MKRIVDRVIDGRWRFGRTGADFGANAIALVIGDNGFRRLVWSKASSFNHAPGTTGMGAISYVPVSLELRTFRKDGNRVLYGGSETLLSGGRLSRKRILSVQDKIDAAFGLGTAVMIDPLKTLLIGADDAGEWLDAEEKRPPYISPEAEALMKAAMSATETFDGIKI